MLRIMLKVYNYTAVAVGGAMKLSYSQSAVMLSTH